MKGLKEYGIPQPYACIPESGILVMEWINGTPLKESLNRIFFARKTRHNLISKSAIWLKEFRQVGELAVEEFDPMSLSKLIENYIDNSGTTFPECKKAIVEAWQILHSEAIRLQTSAEICSLKHGDFTPGNVLHTPEKVFGIDMTLHKRAPVIEDVTRFITELYVNDSFLATAARYYLPITNTKLQSDEKSFLSAYFDKGYEKQWNMILLYLLMHAIKKLVQAAKLVSTHRQEHGYKSPFLLVYRYVRFWKRKMIVFQLQKALSEQ